MIRKLEKLVYCAFFSLAPAPGMASTKVGNGGDIVDRYLLTTRHAVNETLARLRTDNKANQVCSSQSYLTDEQQAYCARFMNETLDDILNLNSGPQATPLQLTSDPLWAEDPWGGRRPVSAGTECGPSGAILFHYDSVKTMTPRELFSLMIHEFGHKVSWEGAACVSDNAEVGPFTDPQGGGRQLLDAVGLAAAHYAVQNGIIGQSFGIVDVFLCTIRNDETGLSFPSYPQVERLITDPENLTSYVSGVGHTPRAPECVVVEDFGRLKTSFRLRITERANCTGADSASNRTSEVWVVREVKTDAGSETTEILHESWPGLNPLCGHQIAENPFTVTVETQAGQRLSMEIEYLYSQALRDSRIQSEGGALASGVGESAARGVIDERPPSRNPKDW